MNLLIILFLSFSIIKSQENIFKSKEYGFSVVFPDKVESDKLGSYSQAFTSFELIGELFIMYQVQVLNEQPGAPLYFNTIEENRAFLFTFLKTIQDSFYNSVLSKKEIIKFKNKYHALAYQFHGNWINDIPVYNKGFVILDNHKLFKISLIYSKELHNKKFIESKYTNFINSFYLIE